VAFQEFTNRPTLFEWLGMHIMLDMHMRAMHIWTMTLAEYLKHTKESDAAFAFRAELSQSQVNRLRRGQSRPSWATIDQIAKATGKMVTANDWTRAEEAA
jgi:transcriptional regulator with XRE-family HTH domain